MSPAGMVIERVSDRLLPYIPPPVIEWIAEEPEARHKAVEGTLTFLDISGFTKLSEGLAREGKVGAEHVVDTISSTFSSLLMVARRNGGTLLKFGGDALLLLYTGPDHENRAC